MVSNTSTAITGTGTTFTTVSTVTISVQPTTFFDITTTETIPSSTTKIVSIKSYTPKINPAYLNDSLYPEHSAYNASNYCRDPSRNIAGAWCYTTDPEVPQDLCDIQDCDKPGENIFCLKCTR